jgi:hypothetical protein
MQFKCKERVRALALIAVGGLLSGCDDILPTSSRSVCISGYNQYDRQLHRFWLDNENKSGCWGNPPAPQPGDVYGGGGGHVCGCRVTPGKEVSLTWEFVQTPQNFDAKIPAEEGKITVKIPELKSLSNPEYLRVYFMRNGTAQLQWDEDMSAPELPPPAEGEFND